MPAKKIDKLPGKIAKILREHLKEDTIIDVSGSGVRDNLHILVVSRELDKMTEKEKQEFLWDLIEQAADRHELDGNEVGRISLVLPVSVEELRR